MIDPDAISFAVVMTVIVASISTLAVVYVAAKWVIAGAKRRENRPRADERRPPRANPAIDRLDRHRGGAHHGGAAIHGEADGRTRRGAATAAIALSAGGLWPTLRRSPTGVFVLGALDKRSNRHARRGAQCMIMGGALIALSRSPSLPRFTRSGAKLPLLCARTRSRAVVRFRARWSFRPRSCARSRTARARGTGEPGPRSWVQHARYSIDASIDPSTNTLTGSERVVYLNNSPDTLAHLAVYLRQNVFRAQSPRRDVAPLTDGMKLSRVVANGSTLVELSSDDETGAQTASRAGYEIDGTVMWLTLASPLLPHQSATLELAWSFVPPLTPSDGREGRDDHLYLFGYWYPQVAVYDDVNGWVADPYLLEAEFYMDPADYDVRVTAPRGWVVGATGTLQNGGEILSADARTKLARARATGAVVAISRPSDGAAAFASQLRQHDLALHRAQRARFRVGDERSLRVGCDARARRGQRMAHATPSTSTPSIGSTLAPRRGPQAARATRAMRCRRSRIICGSIRGPR